ncbi:MAG TPA: DNA polymerase/3'-5' exonuclease PolX, partial [Verrucomicrobiae bacterium]|nr:DNA polymerase/3'-5' exonuclease PolX [Verrucomicrobiae bacterium]
RVPGLGAKTALLLFETLGIADLDELEQAAREHRLAGLPGLGEKTEENILKGIALAREGGERHPLGRVLPQAEELAAELLRIAPLHRLEIAGSLRRRRESVKDIDLVGTSPRPQEVMEAFVSLPSVREVLMRGATRSTVVWRDRLQVDLRVVEEHQFGAALAHLTGSGSHNVRLREMAVRQGLKVNEYGIFAAGGTRLGGEEEGDLYRLLGLPWIPPELREDRGEVEAAAEGTLPELLRAEDIRGDLHAHTHWSDGNLSLEELAQAARARGYSWMAVTDHSMRLAIAHGMSIDRLMEQQREVRELNRRLEGFTLLHGAEVDILPDGRLDFPDEVLRELDLVIGAVHSAFGQTRETMTARIIAAMRHPFVTTVAHPTGRLIGVREGYEVEMEALLRAAAETRTAMEINSHPLRLDLADLHVKRGKELGVSFAIGSDAHSARELDHLPLGMSVARRGWLEREDLLNTLEAPELLRRLKRKRGAG